jgi:hypothetical protein
MYAQYPPPLCQCAEPKIGVDRAMNAYCVRCGYAPDPSRYSSQSQPLNKPDLTSRSRLDKQERTVNREG